MKIKIQLILIGLIFIFSSLATAKDNTTILDIDKYFEKNPDFAQQTKEINNIINYPKLEIHGTEYELGETALPFLQLINSSSNNPISNSICLLDLYSPNATKTKILNNTPMINLGDNGIYYYEYTPLELGNHMVSAKCFINNIPISLSRNNTILSGNLISGSLDDINNFDNNPAEISGLVLSGFSIQTNFTINENAINVTNINLYSRIKKNSGANSAFTICVWDYVIKNYVNCKSESVGNEYILINQYISTNSTANNYLQSTTSGIGILSVIINNTGIGNININTDWLNAEIIQGQNQSISLKGSSELHISNSSNIIIQEITETNENLEDIEKDISVLDRLIKYIIYILEKIFSWWL